LGGDDFGGATVGDSDIAVEMEKEVKNALFQRRGHFFVEEMA
jgi:hypothetical protein